MYIYNKRSRQENKIRSGWDAFGKLLITLKKQEDFIISWDKNIYQCILSVLSYEAQTWAFTKQIVYKVQWIGDRKRNEYIRQRTKITDNIKKIRNIKWAYAGHVVRTTNSRWNTKIDSRRP